MQIVDGKVLQVGTRSGTSNGSAYAYVQVHVLDGVQVHQCRLGDDWPGQHPKEGDTLTAEVELRAFVARSGAAGIGVTLLRPLAVSAAPAAPGAPVRLADKSA